MYPFLHLYFLIVPTVDFPGMILAFATSSVGPQAEKQQNSYKYKEVFKIGEYRYVALFIFNIQ